MEKPHIYLIVVDSLRKDYSNNLEDELIKFDFVNYNNVISPSSWTIPTHASLFSGLYPTFHGVHETKNIKGLDIKLKNSKKLLTLSLSEIGYKNILLTANPYVNPIQGFKGFNDFFEISTTPKFVFIHQTDIDKIKKFTNLKNLNEILTVLFNVPYEIFKKLILHKKYKLSIKLVFLRVYTKIQNVSRMLFRRWPRNKGGGKLLKISLKLTKIYHRKTPIFVFINLMEVHNPYFNGNMGNLPFHLNYSSKEEKLKTFLNTKFCNKIKKLYNKEVVNTKNNIIHFIKKLKKLNIYDESLIIITSDHGQLLGEHEKIGHGTFLYDELLKVPLLIKYPKNKNIKLNNYHSKLISLITLNSLILKIAYDKFNDDKILYSNEVFSETYGLHQKQNVDMDDQEGMRFIELNDCRKISMYYKNYKVTFNVKNWMFEEWFNYKSNEDKVPKVIAKYMEKKVINFVNLGSIKRD